MIIKFLAERKKKRIDKMINKLSKLSVDELKMWYSHSEADRLLGHSDIQDHRLNKEIENELTNRGLEYMIDY